MKKKKYKEERDYFLLTYGIIWMTIVFVIFANIWYNT